MDLWFSLRFINIPLSTILLDGFDIIAVELVVIIDVVGLSVDVNNRMLINRRENQRST